MGLRGEVHAQLPGVCAATTELLDVLDDLTADYEKAIEIGAGTGSVGRLLGIKMTDSHLRADKKVQLLYALQGQPVIKYPPDVVKLNAHPT